MKHAILILAHKDIEFVCRLVRYFHTNCEVFVHWDRKQSLTPEQVARLKSYRQVKSVTQVYEVNWGGTSILDCELYLFQIALEKSDADYFHLISGQDYPTRPLNSFFDFFEKNKGKEFLQYVHLPHPNWGNNTFDRLLYYYPYDYASKKEQPRQWVREQVQQQRERGIKRPIPTEFDHIYGSSQWFSVTRKAVELMLEYTQNTPAFYQHIWMTFAPEECYMATVFVNLLGTENVVAWNCRFIRWEYENGNRPANLADEHFHYLLEREYLFARKIETSCSLGLLDNIDKYLLNDDADIKQLPTGGWVYDGFLKYGYEAVFCRFVQQLYWDMGVRTALDMGCGCGYYVSQWRRKGLSFAGYDSNPHTEVLSRMLLPEGDTVCGVADLTEKDLRIPVTFDLVVCKDVLPYIPQDKEKIAIKNLARLSSHAILVSWNTTPALSLRCREIDEAKLIQSFKEEGFVVERYMTARLHVIWQKNKCCLFLKDGKQLLI